VLNKPFKYGYGLDTLYSGEVNAQGQPHGPGEMTVTEEGPYKGTVQTGMFVDGAPYGVGKFVTPHGYKQTGEFDNGDLSGVARIEYADGAHYDGQFKGGKRHGLGTYTYSDGTVSSGWWADDERHGIALFVHAEGKAAMMCEHGKVDSVTEGLIDDACIHAHTEAS
jgi:hypothetical protein